MIIYSICNQLKKIRLWISISDWYLASESREERAKLWMRRLYYRGPMGVDGRSLLCSETGQEARIPSGLLWSKTRCQRRQVCQRGDFKIRPYISRVERSVRRRIQRWLLFTEEKGCLIFSLTSGYAKNFSLWDFSPLKDVSWLTI